MNLQQTAAYWFKVALGALDKAISSTAAITTTAAVTGASFTTTSNGAVTAHGSGDITTTSGDLNTTSGNLTVGGTANITGAITTASLTATRVPYIGTAGLIKDEAAFTYVEGTNTLTVDNVTCSGTVSAEQLTTTDDLTVSGLATITETLGVTGATTLTGGVVATAPLKVWNHSASGALATRGTDAARTAGTTYYAEIELRSNKTITGIAVLLGTTAGTDKILVALYDEAGALLANSAVAGVTTSGGDVYQEVAFDPGTYAAVGPGKYLVAVQINGATDGLQFMTTTGPLTITGSEAGSFGTLLDPITTVATTHTDNTGPLVYLY
jgi:hypothetical protein